MKPSSDSIPNLKGWLQMVRSRIQESSPDLLPLFEVYAGEALFGRQLLDSHLSGLPSGASILEIGAGMLLLSCQLQLENFTVTAVEPIGGGFSHFNQLRRIVLDLAAEIGCAPIMLPITAEELSYENDFDFAFSINVMEHVGNVAVVLRRVVSALKPGSSYYFMCPNYSFPYEPHFNLPTLASKKLTEQLMGSHIFNSKRIDAPEETWKSLNWITVSQVRKICRHQLSLNPVFDKKVFLRFVQRSLDDSQFKSRRGSFICFVITIINTLKLNKLFLLIPATFQPIMACCVTRK